MINHDKEFLFENNLLYSLYSFIFVQHKYKIMLTTNVPTGTIKPLGESQVIGLYSGFPRDLVAIKLTIKYIVLYKIDIQMCLPIIGIRL